MRRSCSYRPALLAAIFAATFLAFAFAPSSVAGASDGCTLTREQLVHSPGCCQWDAGMKMITCHRRRYYDRDAKEWKPVQYSLAGLDTQDGYTKKDSRHGFDYTFDFGSKVAPPQSSCQSTRGDDGKVSTADAAAYQVPENGGENFDCHRLTGDPANSANINVAEITEGDPSQGFVLTVSGGDYCNVTGTGSLGGRARALHAMVYCSTEAEHQGKSIAAVTEISEDVACVYSLILQSSNGCPTTCGNANDRSNVCNGPHGQCRLDLDSNEATCFCDEASGYYGPNCEARCSGFVDGGSDCSGHGHCGYDYGSKSAHCFCEDGYGGDLCNGPAPSAGTSSVAVVGWVFFALTLLAGAVLYVYHKRTIDEPLCSCGGDDDGFNGRYGHVDSTNI